MNKNLYQFYIFLLLVTFLSKPSFASALTVYTDGSNKTINIGDTYVVKVFMDTEGKEINTVEGSLKINGSSKISSINTGGSILNLWAEKPAITNGNEIFFAGGTEGGVYGNNLRLLNFSITPSVTGEIRIEPKDLIAYLNDGIGTKLIGSNSGFVINVVEKTDKKDEIISTPDIDKIPPAPFNIELGRDDFLYGGKYFISFYATDENSGINRYEVKEGNSSFVNSENIYVLKDQSLNSKISVKAIDNAGNEKIQELNNVKSFNLFRILLLVLGIVILVVVIVPLFKIIKNKK